jgi:hypothetical protein
MSCAKIEAAFAAQIDVLIADLAAVNLAISTLISGGAIVSYTLDTSQTKQTVTRAHLGELRLWRRNLMSQLDDLGARQCGAGRYVSHL